MTAAADEVETFRTIADYQFGAGAGRALFPESDRDSFAVERSRSGRPRQVHAGGDRLVTYLTHGRFTLGLEGGRRLHGALSHPTSRVAVDLESEPYVAAGRNAFAKFVLDVDETIRPRDEVLVVHDGRLLAVGRAELSAAAMRDFETGMAVRVRAGVEG